MNYYSLHISPTREWSQSDFKALMLMYLTSLDFDITQTAPTTASISAHLDYSLSNLNANPLVLRNPIYSTEHQSTVERFDKPIVETGDLVLTVIEEDKEDSVSKYYNEFVRFELPIQSGGQEASSRPATKDEVSGKDTGYLAQGGELVLDPATPGSGTIEFPEIDPTNVIVFIGVSNSSKSDFNEPFNEAKYTVIASQEAINDILNKEA